MGKLFVAGVSRRRRDIERDEAFFGREQARGLRRRSQHGES
ncbi:MAG: hypothetical protein ABR863_06805 [Roseiarcus sp.]|jgi:hypothetical protein